MNGSAKFFAGLVLQGTLLFGWPAFPAQTAIGGAERFENSPSYKRTAGYIQSRKDFFVFLLGLNEENTAASGEKLSKYLQANYSNIDLKSDYLKTRDISALCYAAAEIQCPTPIAMFPELFAHTIFWYEKYVKNSLTRVEDKLEDYPFMFLAVQCGPQSIPALQSIILDPERRAELRLKAIATLMKIDPEAAAASALRIQDELNPEMRSILTSYLENPQTEPWEVLVRFSSRSRAIMERKTSNK